MSYMTKQLYKTQDHVLDVIFRQLAPLFKGYEIILAGGTALARYYLHHRVSYDLDFFLSKTFDPVVLQRRLNDLGLTVETRGMESGGALAAQFHGKVKVSGGEQINISFVEDVFAGMFKSGDFDGVHTEVLNGLYHRKLRTVSGTGVTLSMSGRPLGQGHRQKARDLFDLYVLDTKIVPIEKFIRKLEKSDIGFPADIFRQNLAAILWLELIDECEMLEVLPPFEKIQALDLKRHFDDVMKRMLECGL